MEKNEKTSISKARNCSNVSNPRNRKMKRDGKLLPELLIQSVQLFGKDGHHKIKITTQSIHIYGNDVTTSPGLLGTNACTLGLQFLDGKGQPSQAFRKQETKPLI